MKTPGHASLRRAISLDRISASLRKKKRFTADVLSTQEGNFERELGGVSGIRTACHKTSRIQFFNWVAYSRDLSPEITENQRRTCPVCEQRFQDRGAMLRHICMCPQLVDGFYTCNHCNQREKLGRYHTSGCSEILDCQDNWFKRIFPFRNSEVLVDASEKCAVPSEVVSWERSELPAQSLVEMDARKSPLELEGNGERSTPELDDGWLPLELDCGSNWGPVELSPWQPVEPGLESYAELPALESRGELIPVPEVPSCLPAELPGHSQGDVQLPVLAEPIVDTRYQESASPSSHEVVNAHLYHDIQGGGNETIVMQSRDNISARGEMVNQPALRLDTRNFAAELRYSHENENYTKLHYCDIGHQAPNDSPDIIDVQSHNNVLDAQFPSPPTSPTPWYEHDTPVSPIEESPWSFQKSKSSRFSSMSSLLLDETPMSSFSSGSVMVELNKPSSTRVFEDREMCFEPEDMDYLLPSWNDGTSATKETDEMMYPDAAPEAASLLSTSADAQSAPSGGFGFNFLAFENLLASSAGSSFDEMSYSETGLDTVDLSSVLLEDRFTLTGSFDYGFTNATFQQDHSSAKSSSASPGTYDLQPSPTPSPHSSSSGEDLPQSAKSNNRRSLARSPAFRAVYKCTYGPCTFVPTGKPVYHKRTLQRHQEKCFYSPLPREKKPCKCTFPGCKKGFSRSDGLNAHRKTSGHSREIEFQIRQGNGDSRESVGFS